MIAPTAERQRPRVIIADDHAMLADGMALILRAVAEVVATAHDGQTLVARTYELRPDVVITDLSMPLLSGLDATRAIRLMDPPPEVIVVTAHSDHEMQEAAFAAGARGYVLKSAAAVELQVALATVMRGERYSSVVEETSADRPASRLDMLTSREREVLALVASGLTAKEVGARLGISERTVSFHKDQMKHRLGARSTIEVVNLYLSEAKPRL
jgi:DNA-binding NarL/FixJ family response regulator